MNRLIISVLFLIFAVIHPAHSAERLTPEALWKMKRVSSPAISPDGKTVVFAVKVYDTKTNTSDIDLYTTSVDGGEARLLSGGPQKDMEPSWSPDGKKIYFLSDRTESVQLWSMDSDGAGAQQISSTDGSISSYGIADDGESVWFTKDVKIGKTVKEQYPDLPLTTGRIYDDLMYMHWDEWQDENWSHVFIAKISDGKLGEATDIMAGEPFDTPMKPFDGGENISWSPDAKLLAYTCKKLSGAEYATSTNSDIYLYDLEKKTTNNLSASNPGYDKNPEFSPDGSKLIWLSMATPKYESDRNRIMEHDLRTGKTEELTKGFDYTVDDASYSHNGSDLFFVCKINATQQIWKLEQDSSDPFRQLTSDIANHTGFDLWQQKKKSVMITTMMSMSMPTELMSVDLKSGESTQITNLNKDILDNISMGKVEKRMVKATDGEEILTWVIYPPDFDPSKKYPTLLYCQGGPQSTVSQFFSFRWNFQLMAANDYIIVAPNRRGLPSFGEKWNRDISGDWGGQAMKDLLSAIDEVSKEPYVDADRLGAVGASFGGYSVYWLAGNHEKRFKSFIAHDGVFNFESMYGITEEIFFADFDMEGPYWKEPKPKSYTEFSPHLYVNNWDTPILIIHNDKDFRVPLSQGQEAFTAARLHGVDARFLSFPDENHWMLKPQNAILWQRVFFEWLDKYLK
jgi:dipeptidyl aminopeptidase/acylaminoacyl peptidase